MLLTAAALSLALPLAACGGSGESSASGEKVTFMMDVGLLPKHALFYAAVDHGFYEDAGFDVEILPGTGSKDTSLAVSTGRADFGFADFGQSVLARSEGAGVTQLGLIQSETAYATVTTSKSGIDDWDDLVGKKVATEAGGAMTAMWPLAAERAGLDKDDVEVVASSGQAKITGLLTGQWDATLAFYISDAPVLIAQGEKPVVLKWSDLDISMYGNGLITSDKAVADDPERVKAFVGATMRGVTWACKNQDQAVQSLMDSVREMDSKAATAGVEQACGLLWPKDAPDGASLGSMDDEGAEHVFDLVGTYLDVDSTDISTADVYTNEFLPEITTQTQIEEPKQ
ncbi:ABC transporter substrate-binding protein [Janibacter melonis]